MALIDSGAGGMFIDFKTVFKLRLNQYSLPKPIDVFNADGTGNKLGQIKHYVKIPLVIGGKTFHAQLYVTSLGKQDIILGMTWLKLYNPIINWQQGTLQFRTQGQVTTKPENENQHVNTLSPEDPALLRHVDEDTFYIRTIATEEKISSEEQCEEGDTLLAYTVELLIMHMVVAHKFSHA